MLKYLRRVISFQLMRRAGPVELMYTLDMSNVRPGNDF